MLRFWGWMDKEIKAGRIVSAERVYKEVVEGRKTKDAFAEWMQPRKANENLSKVEQADRTRESKKLATM